MNYPPHLSPEELERYAFLAGDGLVASLAETATDLEQQNLHYQSTQDTLTTQAFEAGKLEGLGEDVQAVITDLTAQAAGLRDQLGKATELLGVIYARLLQEHTRTTKSRKALAQGLAAEMAFRGLGRPWH